MEIKATLQKPYTDIDFVPVVGYEDTHIINKDGVVIRLYKNSYTVLKPVLMRQGYLKYNMCVNNKPKQVFMHRMIAQAFIPNPENKKCVNHKNGIKHDNRIENLEWCTHQENNIHKFEVLHYKHPKPTEQQKLNMSLAHKGKMTGKENHKSIPVLCIEKHKVYECLRQCAEDIGGTVQGVWDVLNGRYNKHRGYTFKYMEVI